MNYQQQIKLRAWLRRPLWTYAFLGIQTAVFLMMELFPRLEIPYYAGMYGPYLVHFNEWWRLVTPIFIHFGLMHFVMNSLILYFMGQQIEAIYGHWRFFLIYMFSGIMGNTASFAFNEANVLSGGASTSIFGLFGALFILGFHFKHNPAIQQLVRHFSFIYCVDICFWSSGYLCRCLGTCRWANWRISVRECFGSTETTDKLFDTPKDSFYTSFCISFCNMYFTGFKKIWFTCII